MSGSLSFENLPSEVLEQILAFAASEPASLCRLACTCKVLSEAVSSNTHLWERLYRARWTFISKKIPAISQEGYRQRHVRDGLALNRVLTIAKSLEKKRHYGLGHKYNDPMWIQMCDDVDSFDVLRFIVRNKPNEIQAWYSNRKITPLVQSIAAQLLEHVHFRIVMQNYHYILTSLSVWCTDAEGLERSCLMIAQGLWQWDDLVEDASSHGRIRTAWATLDRFGDLLRIRLDKDGGVDKVGNLDAVRLLRTIIMYEIGFLVDTRNDATTNLQPLLLDRVLTKKTGTPVMIAIIYKCVLARVGIKVEIVRLADERLVIGLPEDEVVIDVFEDALMVGQRILPFSWNPAQLKPLAPTHVVYMIVNEISARLDQHPMTGGYQACTTRLYFSMARTALLGRLNVFTKPSKPFGLHRYLTCIVDPDIFHHFGLISKKTARRRTKAPLFHAARFAIAEWIRIRLDRNYEHHL